MPIYLYQNPKTKEIKEVIQAMNDEHVYFDEGQVWERVFTSPQAKIESNPWSTQDFVDKTSKKDSMGAIWDRSREWSEKRAKSNGGSDPVKEKYYEDYSKKRNGKPHLDKIKKAQEKGLTIDISKKLKKA